MIGFNTLCVLIVIISVIAFSAFFKQFLHKMSHSNCDNHVYIFLVSILKLMLYLLIYSNTLSIEWCLNTKY